MRKKCTTTLRNVTKREDLKEYIDGGVVYLSILRKNLFLRKRVNRFVKNESAPGYISTDAFF